MPALSSSYVQCLSSGWSVLNTKDGKVYFQEHHAIISFLYQFHRNSSTSEWGMQWWHMDLKMCVHEYNSLKKAERGVKTSQWAIATHQHHPIGQHDCTSGTKWLWKAAIWLEQIMSVYPLVLYIPSYTMTWNCGNFLPDGFFECWLIKNNASRVAMCQAILSHDYGK